MGVIVVMGVITDLTTHRCGKKKKQMSLLGPINKSAIKPRVLQSSHFLQH